MNIFKRIFKIGEAEANSALDKMEDPIKLTEQGIRDLRSDLTKSLEALAQVKALAIRARNDNASYKAKAESYQSKAVALLKRGQSGDIAAEESDRLAKEALTKKQEMTDLAANSAKEQARLDTSIKDLERKIQDLKSMISKFEGELKTLKSRVTVSKAKSNLNKQLAEIDSSSTVSMLERMREKVDKEEALAEAYGDIANEGRTIDEEIDKAIDVNDMKADDQLEALKKEMGLTNDNPE